MIMCVPWYNIEEEPIEKRNQGEYAKNVSLVYPP